MTLPSKGSGTLRSRRALAIIPALNERDAIAAVIADVRSSRESVDVVVIDDGSVDGTGDLARELGVHVVSMPFNLGIGGAVQTGMIYATAHGYDLAVQVDGDGQHMADQIPALVEKMDEAGANVVIGSRFLSESTFRATAARRSGIRILSSLVSVLSGAKFTDATSGFRLYDRSAIRFLSVNYPEDYPEVEAVLALRRVGFTVVETPVHMRERAAGESSITPWRAVYYMSKVILALFVEMLRRPMNEAAPE
jgi:glycosyltransferase involved in cell wall biosynthesis